MSSATETPTSPSAQGSLSPEDVLLVDVLLMLIGDGGHIDLAALSPAHAVVRWKGPKGATDILLLRADTEDARLRAILRAPKTRPLDVVLVGGDARRTTALRKAKGLARCGLGHVRDDRSVWAQGTNAFHLLQEGTQVPVLDEAVRAHRWVALLAATEELRAQTRQSEGELFQFRQMMGRRPLRATYGLLACFAVAFVFQLIVGLDRPPQWVRMGALVPFGALDGEYWRLVSCTLLHGGWMHVAVNSYVTFVLGSFLERVLGPWRLLLLFVGSAVVGSAGSTVFLEGVSMGASGGVWGMLAAFAVLAYGTAGIFPRAMVPGVRKAAKFNLGINILVSFAPQIDLWAHLFGGLTGALIMLALLRGVPRFGSEASDSAVSTDGATVRTSSALVFLAGAMAVLWAGSLPLAVVLGQPFALADAPRFEERTLEDLGVALVLPTNVTGQEILAPTQPGVREGAFGEILHDPMVVGVITVRLEPLTAEEAEAEMIGLINALQLPDGATVTTPPSRYTDDGDLALQARSVFPSGLALEQAFVMREELLVRVDVYRWPGMASAPEGTATRIVSTARSLVPLTE